MSLSAIGGNAGEPQIAIAPNGSTTAVWSRSNGTYFIIQSASTAQPSYALNLTRSGTGQGKVTSTPGGIDCGTICSTSYLSYAEVTLTAAADSGSSFTGWGGACSGTTSTCKVTMNEAESVSADFTLNPPPPPPPPSCKKATLKLGKFKQNRKKGTGTLKAKAGMAGKVTLKGSKTVRQSSKKLKKKGTVRLKVRAKGKAARKLKRKGSVKVKVKVIFRPGNGCKSKTRTRTVKLVKRR